MHTWYRTLLIIGAPFLNQKFLAPASVFKPRWALLHMRCPHRPTAREQQQEPGQGTPNQVEAKHKSRNASNCWAPLSYGHCAWKSGTFWVEQCSRGESNLLSRMVGHCPGRDRGFECRSPHNRSSALQRLCGFSASVVVWWLKAVGKCLWGFVWYKDRYMSWCFLSILSASISEIVFMTVIGKWGYVE